MSKRINIVLPDSTLAVLDRVATKGGRSQFISQAVLHFIQSQGKEALRERIKREAIASAPRDVEMAADWFSLEEESALRAAAPSRKALPAARKRNVA